MANAVDGAPLSRHRTDTRRVSVGNPDARVASQSGEGVGTAARRYQVANGDDEWTLRGVADRPSSSEAWSWRRAKQRCVASGPARRAQSGKGRWSRKTSVPLSARPLGHSDNRRQWIPLIAVVAGAVASAIVIVVRTLHL